MDTVDRDPGPGQPSPPDQRPVTTIPADAAPPSDEKPVAKPTLILSCPSTEPPASSVPPGSPSSNPQPGAALRLARTTHTPSDPHPSTDLLSLFRLNPLVATVARTDPHTGAKINKLRKSYEGQLKTFGLAGRNKAVKHDPEDSRAGIQLVELAAWPEEEWRAQKVGTLDLRNGLSAGAKSRLERALRLEPGPVPRGEEWEAALGHEKPRAAGTADGKGKAAAPAAGAMAGKMKASAATSVDKPNGTPTGATHESTSAAEGVARPSRAGKRRRYNDESFEGYGDGFVDDDREDGGDSSDGGSRQSSGSRKKRRKSSNYNAISPTLSDHRGSFGSGGIQHVGRGIGAFGAR